jgi:predicted nucleic acid-binding protein
VTAVVDTNVVAYYLLSAPAQAEESRQALERATTLLAPVHWEAELTNVVWMAVRHGVLTEDDGPMRLGLARRLGVESVATSTLCQGALLRAFATGVTVYDTLFVELAMRSGCPLLTFDKAVLRAFPDVAIRPRDF